MVSPTTAEHVLADLGDAVDYVLDGGPCPVGVESTIVDCTVQPPQILRPGGIPAEQIAALLGGDLADPSGPSRASGMLASHYAPRARVVLAETRAEALLLAHDLERRRAASTAPQTSWTTHATSTPTCALADDRGAQLRRRGAAPRRRPRPCHPRPTDQGRRLQPTVTRAVCEFTESPVYVREFTDASQRPSSRVYRLRARRGG